MNPQTKIALKQRLIREEGCKEKPYTDSTGHLTIGVGRNLTTRGISLSEAYLLLDNDVEYFEDYLNKSLPCYNKLSDVRQAIIVDMCFNLGLQGFLKFHNLITMLSVGKYEEASNEMLNSQWATQVGRRAKDLASAMRTNQLLITG